MSNKEDFIERLRNNRGYSECSIRNYELSLRLFDEYLKKVSLKERGINDVEKIKLIDIDFFIRNQRILGKSVKTCNLYCAGIKLYLRFMKIRGKKVIDYNSVLFARERKNKIESLSEDDAKRLYNYFKAVECEGRRADLIKTRNLLIVQLLLYAGLRVSELSNIKIEDIAEEMQIIGKGGKRRTLNLFKEDIDLIDLYLFMRKDNSEYLFVSHAHNTEGHQLTSVSIESIIRTGAKKAGIKGKVFPHKLRHTFATRLMNNNVNLAHIQQLLGHSSLATTQNYLTVLNHELKDDLKKVGRF